MLLNEAQIKAINTNGNIVVVASAGSGKSATIIERTKRLIGDGINPNNILLITFSRDARDNLVKRLHDNDANAIVETFHSFALKIIRDKYGNKYSLWDKGYEKEKIIQDSLKELHLFDPANPYEYLPTCTRFIAAQKHRMLKPGDNLYYKGFGEFTQSSYEKIYKKYETYRMSKDLIEFDDFLNMAYDILSKDKKLLSIYREQHKYVMADEFQDVSKNQAMLLRLINDTETMIVGDPLQAIYAFRGGDSSYILNFDKDYKDVTVINLNINYRCKDEIVESSNDFADEFIPDTKHRNYVRSVAHRKDGVRNEIKGYLSEIKEANAIAKHIVNNNMRPKDVAVLARTNAQLQNIQNSLTYNGIPFQMLGTCLYTEQMEIKLILSYLHLVDDTNDDEAFKYVYNKPNRWLGKAFLEEVHKNCYQCSYYDSMNTIKRRNWKFKKGIEEIQDIITLLKNTSFNNIGEMVQCLRKNVNIDDYVKKDDNDDYEERIENMDSFQKTCERFTTLDALFQFLTKLTNNSSKDSVKLMTIHKSKGLEFPYVFMIGLDNSHMPHKMSNNIDDEARVMYVGMTRAADRLYMSYSGDEPSIFLM